jgi:hypothetical protein
MTDTRVGPDVPRIRRASDLLSGEELEIAYFPKTDGITINGYSVIRSPGLTDRGGETVFHQVLGGKKFIVATNSIADLYI